MLIHYPAGHYSFLKGIEPYSCGVVADAGWEIVRLIPETLLPWREGFEKIEACLREEGLERTALCAVELRSPAPFSMDGFKTFNRGYREVLERWGLLAGGMNPVARTNVAPVAAPPAEVALHAFSVSRPKKGRGGERPSFVVAGAGELREGILESERIIRRGEVSRDALEEKAAYVLSVMEERLRGLGMAWDRSTRTQVYTEHRLDPSLAAKIEARLGASLRHGVCWQRTRPPVLEIEFEMDVMRVAEERLI